ncbi:MAG: mechanosensitive ion channel family protein [Gammaproteobacteria bacterium]|nr:mechanosensitive ion channel family protein [Gammaproteobacteria bacterium]
MVDTLLTWIENNNWIVHIFGVIFVTVFINAILRVVLNRLNYKAELTANVWDDAVIFAGKRPLLLFVWVIGLSIAVEIVEKANTLSNELFEQTGLVRQIAIILLLMMFLVRLIKNIEKNFLEKTDLKEVDADEVTVKVIGRLLRISVTITGLLVILQTLDISISGVLAFGGIGGIAVGFAAKDLLANFFGSLMIYLDRPFSIGDWVRSPDREIEGTVEDIGWRLTKIRTFDKRPLYIPNAMFNTVILENPSRMTNRRIYETFGLRYSDSAKIGDIVAAVKTMLQEHDEIDISQTLIVNFNSLAASSLDFFVYTFTKTTNWVHYHEVKQDVLLKIIDIIHAHGADIAFPTRTLDGLDALKEQS